MPNNMEPKILLIGGGYLGSRIAEFLQAEVVDIGEIDITELESVERVVAAKKPTHVINAAAMANTADLEKPEMKTLGYRVNVQGPANLALVAERQDFHLTHISTGMLFDGAGADGQGVKETDLPTPNNYYCWTKAWADAQLLPLHSDRVLITRIHTPLSRFDNPKNYLTKLRGFNKVVDAPQSLTIVEDLLVTLKALLEQRATGIYNVVNPGAMSAWDIVELMKKHGLVPADKEVAKMTRAELDAQVAANGGAQQTFPILATEKLARAGIILPEVHEAVEQAILNFVHAGS